MQASNQQVTRIKYWECPQDPSHVWDWDDWRISENYWNGKAYCPKDHRVLTPREAVIQ